MPQFYLAIGSKPRKRDLVVAKLVGQRHILVPLGSAGADLVRADDDLVVVGDSGAWPPGRRDRITLAAYAREVRAWGDGLAWAMSYDTIGDVEASARDDARLRARIGPVARVVPVVAVGSAASDALDVRLDDLDDDEAQQALEVGVSDALGPIDHPALAIGGIAASRFSGHTVETLRVFADLEGCFDLLDEHPDAAPAAAHEALFHDGSELAVRFAIAVIRERMGVELRADEELSEMAIIEILDPAKGYPTLQTRAYAALIALAIPGSAEERRNDAYFASYLLRYDPGLGLAVSLNEMRERHGLGPTGW